MACSRRRCTPLERRSVSAAVFVMPYHVALTLLCVTRWTWLMLQEDNESSYWDDSKSRRTEPRGELDECTFRPQIRPLPEYYGSQKQLDSVPFEQRVKQWHQHREASLQRQREKEDSKEVGHRCRIIPRAKSRVARAQRVCVPTFCRWTDARFSRKSIPSHVQRPLAADRMRDCPCLIACTFKRSELL
jgi:hypothetical protein